MGSSTCVGLWHLSGSFQRMVPSAGSGSQSVDFGKQPLVRSSISLSILLHGLMAWCNCLLACRQISNIEVIDILWRIIQISVCNDFFFLVRHKWTLSSSSTSVTYLLPTCSRCEHWISFRALVLTSAKYEHQIF